LNPYQGENTASSSDATSTTLTTIVWTRIKDIVNSIFKHSSFRRFF